MNSAVAAQLCSPKCLRGPPDGDLQKRISKALLYWRYYSS